MSNIIKNIEGEVICVIYILSVFIISIPFYKINSEYSRKVIHILLGNFYFIALLYFTEWYFTCLGPFIFIFVNYFSVKYRYIKLMLRNPKKLRRGREKDGGEGIGGGSDYGTVYYAISLTLITIYSWKNNKPEIGLCPFLSMAFGDGLAGVLGSSIKSHTFIIFESKKSVVGCSTMFLTCFFIYEIYFLYFEINKGIIKAFFMGIISMILEAISPNSTDNLTVPLADLILMCFLY